MNVLRSTGLAQDARGAIAGGGVGVNRMRILLDDLAGHRIDEPAIAIQDWDDDVVAAGGALTVLAGHAFVGFEARGAISAVEAVAFSPARAGAEEASELARRKRCAGACDRCAGACADELLDSLGRRDTQRRETSWASNKLPHLPLIG